MLTFPKTANRVERRIDTVQPRPRISDTGEIESSVGRPRFAFQRQAGISNATLTFTGAVAVSRIHASGSRTTMKLGSVHERSTSFVFRRRKGQGPSF